MVQLELNELNFLLILLLDFRSHFQFYKIGQYPVFGFCAL